MSHHQTLSPGHISLMVPEQLLGSGPKNDWRDMSDYLIHFTSEEENFKQILSSGTLKRGKPYGFRRFRSEEVVRERHRSVCFSEIPLDQLSRLSARKGRYDIGFSKKYLQHKGGTRVWYIEKESPQAQAIHVIAELALKQNQRSHPIWNLTPFVDPLIPRRYYWDHEREWRIQGDLHFSLEDVSFLITPDSFTEFPSAGPVFYSYQDLELVTTSSSSLLNELLQAMIEEYYDEFRNPADVLPMDRGEYIWNVTEWSTEDALEDLFSPIEPTIFAELAKFLNSESASWVRREDDLDYPVCSGGADSEEG